jgi:hypothetical protein
MKKEKKEPSSLFGTVRDVINKILPTLPADEQRAWNEQSKDSLQMRIGTMGSWIVLRNSHPPLDKHNIVSHSYITEAKVLAAYRATQGVVFSVSYVPSREKKWAAKGMPVFSKKNPDGSDFDCWPKVPGVPDKLECPKCHAMASTRFDNYDADNDSNTGVWSLRVFCLPCDYNWSHQVILTH